MLKNANLLLNIQKYMNTIYSLLPTNTTLVYNNGSLVPVNSTSTNMSTNRKVAHKIGRFVGKIKRFFKRTETKVAAIATYWAVETALFALIILSAPSLSVALAGLFLYLYGSYALFAAINTMIG